MTSLEIEMLQALKFVVTAYSLAEKSTPANLRRAIEYTAKDAIAKAERRSK